MTTVNLADSKVPALNDDPKAVAVMQKLAERGIDEFTVVLHFSSSGHASILSFEHWPFDCGPFLKFKKAEAYELMRHAEELTAIVEPALGLSLKPLGIELRDLLCMVRVSTTEDSIEVSHLANCEMLSDWHLAELSLTGKSITPLGELRLRG